MLVILRPLVSSQLRAQRRSRVGVRELSSSSLACSLVPGFTVQSGSYTKKHIIILYCIYSILYILQLTKCVVVVKAKRTKVLSFNPQAGCTCSGKTMITWHYLEEWATVCKQPVWVERRLPRCSAPSPISCAGMSRTAWSAVGLAQHLNWSHTSPFLTVS